MTFLATMTVKLFNSNLVFLLLCENPISSFYFLISIKTAKLEDQPIEYSFQFFWSHPVREGANRLFRSRNERVAFSSPGRSESPFPVREGASQPTHPIKAAASTVSFEALFFFFFSRAWVLVFKQMVLLIFEHGPRSSIKLARIR
jgi:hypothetical protein